MPASEASDSPRHLLRQPWPYQNEFKYSLWFLNKSHYCLDALSLNVVNEARKMRQTLLMYFVARSVL
jgi:hypothetical protein